MEKEILEEQLKEIVKEQVGEAERKKEMEGWFILPRGSFKDRERVSNLIVGIKLFDEKYDFNGVLVHTEEAWEGRYR